MANIGYIQVVRHCNHFCGFCSNPTTPYEHTLESMKLLVDDFVKRKYFGVILTGGEPSLHPKLPQICDYARSKGLHVRMITNGDKLADEKFAKAMANAGLLLAHISVYSVHPKTEEVLRGQPNTLEKAFKAMENCHKYGIDININSVISKYNASHLHENIEYFIKYHPYIKHFVWNNIDASMGRAEVNQQQFIHSLKDLESSLHKALTLLHNSGRTFRVERVPLCYMSEFAWASTETRKIIKGEERIVHFLDQKQTVRQTRWDHLYVEACEPCSLKLICGGLFNRGEAFDSNELAPVFVEVEPIIKKVLSDENDPSYQFESYEQWKEEFKLRLKQYQSEPNHNEYHQVPESMREKDLEVGMVSQRSQKVYNAKRKQEAKKASTYGTNLDEG